MCRFHCGPAGSRGQAIRDSDVPREEIFVITKLCPSQFDNAAAETAYTKIFRTETGKIFCREMFGL